MVKTLGGERYFLTIVDDYSRFTWIHLMRSKSDTQQLIKNFHKFVHTQFAASIKIIRTDNGGEFSMFAFFEEHGIIHQRSCVNTPQQNAVVERKHQHLLNVARALRFQANLPLEFWGQCVLHAAFLINRLPSLILDWQNEHQENVSTEFEPSLPIIPISQHEEFQFDTPVHALDDNLVPPLVCLEPAEIDTSGNDDLSLALSEQAEPNIPPSPLVCTDDPNGSQTDSIIDNGQSAAAPPRRSTRTRQLNTQTAYYGSHFN
nr:uncharacterized protein LOC109162697 [Ipomoea trifida]